jgi:AAA domain-containing protein/primase-like protein/bifunctional DNA primase/polymerase-like protein/helix-turn-helix protein
VDNSLLATALFHHSEGRPVIAVTKDKRPYRERWNEYLTRQQTEEEVRREFVNGTHGIAVVLYPACPYVVLDFDGLHAEAAWQSTGIKLPDTARNVTRSGGVHLIFRMPAGDLPEVRRKVRLVKAPCGCKSVEGRPKPCGVDILVHGYAVFPPTEGYREDPNFPLESAVTIPREILTLAQEVPRTERHVTGDLIGKVHDGERNSTACSLAGTMRKRGMSLESIRAALKADSEQRFDPPLSDKEIDGVLNSAAKWERGNDCQSGQKFVSSPIEKKPCAINLDLQTWGDFLATDFGELPYTVEGLTPDAGLVAFHGRGKDGKSTLIIHACRAIATGQPFLGRATRQKPVIYVNYEMGFGYLQKLFREGGECPSDAYVSNRPEPVLQLSTIEAIMQQAGQPAVMVIDSFRGAFRLQGDAENAAGGAGSILRGVQDLAIKYRWLVIIIHHRNRGAKEGTDAISGTSDWIAAPDVIWTWSRRDKDKPGVLNVEGRLPPVEPLSVQLSPTECTFVGTVEQTAEETDKAAILAALTEEPQEAKAIAEGLGKPASTVRKRLESLYDAGAINREGEGKRNAPFMYSKINCARKIL